MYWTPTHYDIINDKGKTHFREKPGHFEKHDDKLLDESIQLIRDEKTGKVRFQGIEGEFNDAKPFCSGLAAIKKGDYWGYIDKTGKTIVEPQYIEAGYFYNRYALVDTGRNWLFIDKAGKNPYPNSEIYISNIWDHYEIEQQTNTDTLLKTSTTRFGLLSSAGEIVLTPKFQYIRFAKRKSNSHGYWYKTGKLNKPREFYHVATVENRDELYNSNFELLFTMKDTCIAYDEVYDDCFIASKKDQQALISINGKIIVPFGDYSIEGYGNGLFTIQGEGNRQLYNSQGKRLSQNEYSKCYTDKQYLLIYNNQKVGACLYSFDVIEPLYDDIGKTNGVYTAVKTGDLWGYVDKAGKMVVEPRYDTAEAFSNGLAAVKRNGKWGYVNASGEEVIPCVYLSALPYAEGVCLVKAPSKKGYGFVNEHGKEIGKHRYDYAAGFSEGLCLVSRKNHYGYVNTSLKLAIPLRYNNAGSFSSGLAPVQIGEKWGFINANGEMVIEPQFESAEEFLLSSAPVLTGNCWKLIDSNGSVLEKTSELFQKKKKEAGSSCAIMNSVENWGYLRKDFHFYYDEHPYNRRFSSRNVTQLYKIVKSDGTPLVPGYFDSVKRAGKNLYMAKRKNRQTLINFTGNYVSETHFDTVEMDIDSGFIIRKNGKKGVLNREGKTRIAPIYDSIFSTSGIFIVCKDKKVGLIDTKGNMVFPINYEKIKVIDDDLFELKKDGKKNLAARDGKLILNQWADDFDYIKDDDRNLTGTIIIYRGEKLGMIDKTGAELLPVEYDDYWIIDVNMLLWKKGEDTYLFNLKDGTKQLLRRGCAMAYKNGLYSFYEGEKLGIMSIDGKEILKPEYDDICPGDENTWSLEKDDVHCIFFPSTGKIVSSSFVDLVGEERFMHRENYLRALFDYSANQLTDYIFEEFSCFENGIADVKTVTGWGCIRQDGTFAIEPQYEDYLSFNNGLGRAKLQNGLTGYIDVTGKFVIPPKYENGHVFEFGLAFVCSSGKWGVINTKGEWVIQPTFEDSGYVWDDRITIYIDHQEHCFHHNGKEIPKVFEWAHDSNDIEVAGYFLLGAIENIEDSEEIPPILKDLSGKPFTSLEYYRALYISKHHRGMALVRERYPKKGEHSLFSYVNREGRIISDYKYFDARSFRCKIGVVRKHRFWGAIDETGKEVIPFVFDWLGSFVQRGK